MPTINPLLERLGPYPAESLVAQKHALLAAGREVFDFSVGDPIEATDPRIIDSFRQAVPAISQYPTVAGEAECRAASAAWVARRFDVQLNPQRQILPTSGSKEAIFHLPLAFIDPQGTRRRVLFGTPAYPGYARGALFAGGEPWAVPLSPERGYRLEPWTLSEEELSETAIVWINYPHNPTSATVDRPYLERLARFCHERDILLCSDECYVDLYLDGDRPPSVLQVAPSGALAFHSLSKRSGMTGYRAGFVAGDAELITAFRAARANFGVAVSRMVQHAAAWAWSDEEHVERRREVFRRKRDLFRAFFAEVGYEHTPCQATFYLWLRTPGDSDAVAYAERLAQAGILVSPAPQLGVDQPYVRLALVPDETECQRAIALWRTLL